jgi:hypothetical protein
MAFDCPGAPSTRLPTNLVWRFLGDQPVVVAADERERRVAAVREKRTGAGAEGPT